MAKSEATRVRSQLNNLAQRSFKVGQIVSWEQEGLNNNRAFGKIKKLWGAEHAIVYLILNDKVYHNHLQQVECSELTVAEIVTL
jgi:hypothetical protein